MKNKIILLALMATLNAHAGDWIPHASGGLSYVNGSKGSYGAYPSQLEYKDGYAVGGGIEHRRQGSNWGQSIDVDYSHNAVRSINVGGVSKKVGKDDVADSYTGTATLLYHFPKTSGGLRPYAGVSVGVSDTFGNVVPVYQGIVGVNKELKHGWHFAAEAKVRKYGDVEASGMKINSPEQAIITVNMSKRF